MNYGERICGRSRGWLEFGMEVVVEAETPTTLTVTSV